MHKLLLTSVITAGISFGSGLQEPVLLPDSQFVDPSSPNLGRAVLSTLNSQWAVWFNDNKFNRAPNDGFGDFDFDDAVASVIFGMNQVTITFLGETSANINSIWGNGWLSEGQSSTFPTITDGSEFPVYMKTPDGSVYVSGAAGLNPDCTIHAWVTQTNEVAAPEPSTLLFMGVGLIYLGKKKFFKKR